MQNAISKWNGKADSSSVKNGLWKRYFIHELIKMIFLHGLKKQQFGDIVPVNTLVNWINATALPALKQHIKETNWINDSKEIFTLNDSLFTLKASPNGSYGYMYLTATLWGIDKLPAGKWSGKTIPEIGDTISAKVNNLGECYVLGYLLQNEWISIIVKPLNPPEWFIKQNGKSALVTLFGAEIK